MKKVCIVVMIVFLLGIYCFPMNIGKKLEKLQQSPHVSIVYTCFNLEDEKNPIEYIDYSVDVSSEEYAKILELLKEYKYYRGYKTLLPEGNGITGPGNSMSIHTIFITSTNKLSIDGRIYYLSYFDKNSAIYPYDIQLSRFIQCGVLLSAYNALCGRDNSG